MKQEDNMPSIFAERFRRLSKLSRNLPWSHATKMARPSLQMSVDKTGVEQGVVGDAKAVDVLNSESCAPFLHPDCGPQARG